MDQVRGEQGNDQGDGQGSGQGSGQGDQPWDERFDLIVIGSGGGGFAAALQAAALGRRVLVLEKMALVGGTTALSGGVMWIPNNPVILRRGVPDSPAAAADYLAAGTQSSGPGAAPERRQAFLEAGPRMVGFLESEGIRFAHCEGWSCYHELELPGGMERGRGITSAIFDLRRLGAWRDRLLRPAVVYPTLSHEGYHAALGGTNPRSAWSMFRIGLRMARNRLGADLAGMGLALQGQMLCRLLERGVEIRTEAVPVALCRDGNRVSGVVVRREGRERRIAATCGVVIAAGGFSRNLAMRQKYQPAPVSDRWTRTARGDTGEMIEMAVGIGAQVASMEESVWTLTSLLPDGTPNAHAGEMCRPHLILVDATGRRYVNESTSYMAIGQAMHRRHADVSAIPSWFLMERRFLERYRWAGRMPGNQPIAQWVESGYMVRAGSLEDLARQCAFDPAVLRATVERYNNFARTGVDADFGRGHNHHNRFLGDPRVKPNPALGALERAPFYAVRAWPGDIGTCGGLLADAQARVLDVAGAPIPGLYATGNSTATPMGRLYPGPGGTIGPAFVFGYIAARHAAGRISPVVHPAHDSVPPVEPAR